MAQKGNIHYALGFFDGVHKGHQAILAAARTLAGRQGLVPGVFTYENHPQSVVGGSAPPLLTTPWERRRLFAAKGMEQIAMIPFDAAFSAQSPQAFVDMLVEQYGCAGVCCGQNFHFGAKAAGDAQLLQALCRQRGLACEIVAPVLEEGRAVSSTHAAAGGGPAGGAPLPGAALLPFRRYRARRWAGAHHGHPHHQHHTAPGDAAARRRRIRHADPGGGRPAVALADQCGPAPHLPHRGRPHGVDAYHRLPRRYLWKTRPSLVLRLPAR